MSSQEASAADAALQQLRQELHAEFLTLRQQVDSLRQDNNTLRNAVTAAQSEASAAQVSAAAFSAALSAFSTASAASSTPSERRPKPVLLHPEKFGGSITKFDTWKPIMEAKIRVDYDSFGNDAARFYYVFFHLESVVQAMLLPQLEIAEETKSYDYKEIIKQLARVYNNPNKAVEAEDKLYSLLQSTDNLTAFVAKFERLMFEARANEWCDGQKIGVFRNALSQTMRSKLNGQLSLPKTYDNFLLVCQKLAKASGSSYSQYSAPNHSSSTPGPSILRRPSHSADNMDLSNIEPRDPSYPSRPRIKDTRQTDINTVELPQLPDVNILKLRGLHPSYDNRRAPHSTEEDRQRRRLNDQCVRCGDDNHWVQECPFFPYLDTRREQTSGDLNLIEGTEFSEQDSNPDFSDVEEDEFAAYR